MSVAIIVFILQGPVGDVVVDGIQFIWNELKEFICNKTPSSRICEI